jgi:hypothetical protein
MTSIVSRRRRTPVGEQTTQNHYISSHNNKYNDSNDNNNNNPNLDPDPNHNNKRQRKQ